MIKAWLHETHGPVFELFRHFLLNFFDSDMVTATGQTTTALIGAISMLLPCSVMFVQPLQFKYEHFSRLALPGPYREALRADHLWLLTLMMSAVGLLTAVKWQGLFPGLRDYRALASLPLRPAQVFLGKCVALLTVATAVTFTLTVLPAMVFSSVSTSRWAIVPLFGPRVLALAEAMAGGCYFVLFATIGLQGVLLNILRPRTFQHVTGYLQGLLAAAMLILLVMSFSIQPQIANAALQPELARWLPPVWFLGLHQAMLGDPDPSMQALAHAARLALAIAGLAAAFAYLVSYRRHRVLLVEGLPAPPNPRRWPTAVLNWLVPNPRRQAILVFMVKTMSGSGQHRMVLMTYGGFGLAILLTGLIGIRESVPPARVVAACFVYAHITLLAFLLIGLRHLFSIPTELGANWAFRITERQGRAEWMRAVDQLVLSSGLVAMIVAPLPVELRLLGWRAVAEAGLFAMFGLLCYEAAFSSWEKLPFTCSYLPGKTPGWLMAMALIGLLTMLPMLGLIMVVCLYNPAIFAIVAAILLVAWVRVHKVRRETWGEVPLQYEDLPEPAVRGLNLGQ